MCLYMLFKHPGLPRIIPLGSGRPELCSVKVRTFFEKRPTSNYGVAIRFLGRKAASGAHLGLCGLGTYLYGVQKPRGVDISPAEELPEW